MKNTIPAVLALGMAFSSGWLSNEYLNARKLARIAEERDAFLEMSKAAVSMSERSLQKSLENAQTLEVCLGKIGLKPAVLTPTQKKTEEPDGTRLAHLRP